MCDMEVFRIENGHDVTASFHSNGAVDFIKTENIQINLMPGTPMAAGGTNLYLRVKGPAGGIVPMLGPGSGSSVAFGESGMDVVGEWNGVGYSCRCLLAPNEGLWLWEIKLFNRRAEAIEADVVYVQDVALAEPGAVSSNILYVSQYLEYTALEHEACGTVVCCRQNQHGGKHKPMLMLGALEGVESFATDGVRFFGPEFRANGVPVALKQERLGGLWQGELGLVALQSKVLHLAAGSEGTTTFIAVFRSDQPQPVDADDLSLFDFARNALGNLQNAPADVAEEAPAESIFSSAPLADSADLDAAEIEKYFDSSRHHEEVEDGKLLSFFTDDRAHVVLRAKELLTARPHGHIMKSGAGLEPDEAIISSTCLMFGVFHSHITQGNTNFNRLLSVNEDPLNLMRNTGTRIFVRLKDELVQLGVPSAYEMRFGGCRWIYKLDETVIEVRSWAAPETAELKLQVAVLEGGKLEMVVSNALAPENGWGFDVDNKTIVSFKPSPESLVAKNFLGGGYALRMDEPTKVQRIGGDELLFADGKSREQRFCVVETTAVDSFSLRFHGALVECAEPTATPGRWDEDMVAFEQRYSSVMGDIKLLSNDEYGLFDAMAWFAQNADIHFLAPHGIEQYNGAAWGTRDICQGPFELLLTFGHYKAARTVLHRIFSNQNLDGNWPQWWMFDRYRQVRADESHGDVIFWPMLALSQYLAATEDYGFLDEELGYFESGTVETLDSHVGRIIDHVMKKRLVGSTKLVTYGEGDWNDALQPAKHELAENMVSAWTVGLSYQTFSAYASACRRGGRGETADRLDAFCDEVREQYSALLIKDGVSAGFGLLNERGGFDLLLHPSDESTGISYRLLPMIRGIISGLFTKEQAVRHARLIETHLKGPDGARLMNRPPEYLGGVRKYFCRAETSPFFGREVGCMYTHAHLRYAEAISRLGEADLFLKALRQVVPINYREVVPVGGLRQANCYYSSSDADFSTRYEVNEHYDDLLAGKVTVNGGWRIYSSGPGIFIRLVVGLFFGVRRQFGATIIDPVMPSEFDGCRLQTKLCGKLVELVYHVSANSGPTRIVVNGGAVSFERESNTYRTGGAVISDDVLCSVLTQKKNTIEIHV